MPIPARPLHAVSNIEYDGSVAIAILILTPNTLFSFRIAIMIKLLESPWPILFIGILVEAALAVLFFQTGRGKLLWAILGVAVLLGGGLVVERLVVTDREAVANTIDAAVAAVRANNKERLLACVSPNAKPVRQMTDYVFNLVEFIDAGISNLEITVGTPTGRTAGGPQTAVAKFTAIGHARDRLGQVPYQGFMQELTVNFRREGDRWLIDSYNAKDQLPVR